MKYKSTRGGISGVTFQETLFSGYAPDGGLYVPETIPALSPEVVAKWKESPPSYQQVLLEIVQLFVDETELPRDVLKDCIKRAHAEFDVDTVIGLRQCKGGTTRSDFTVVELFHGKTKSFKDYALSVLGNLMQYFVKKRNGHATILVGTSGDTGSAAIEAVRGLEDIDIIVLYPKGKVSEVQELQMITVNEKNVHVFAVEGTSDELDEPIKQSFPAPDLLSINSINWTRVMIQISHFVYLCTLERCQPVDIYVPTGGCGNLAAAILASRLGFPVNLFSAQNVNDNVVTLINKGVIRFGGDVAETYSNAMDIRYPYNVERLLYFLSDCQTVDAIMKRVQASPDNLVEIPNEVFENLRKFVKGAMKVDTPTTLKTIAECWETNKYIVCPHTATALAFFHFNNQQKDTAERPGNKAYIIATASPEKFPDATKAANINGVFVSGDGKQKKLTDILRARSKKEPKLMRKGEDWYQILQDEIKLIGRQTA